MNGCPNRDCKFNKLKTTQYMFGGIIEVWLNKNRIFVCEVAPAGNRVWTDLNFGGKTIDKDDINKEKTIDKDDINKEKTIECVSDCPFCGSELQPPDGKGEHADDNG